jgi:non-canonical (house-cleaning) NTP pyrophosphatase
MKILAILNINTDSLKLQTPVVQVLAVTSDGVDMSKTRKSSSQNAAIYIQEVIQLMSDPSVTTIPYLQGTGKLVSPSKHPELPTFPIHSYPTQGSTVLLVIPTENKQKTSLLRDFLVEKAPCGVTVHTIAVPVESEVGEQPYNEAGADGAYNRINNALHQLHQDKFKDLFRDQSIGSVMVASIENYIQTEDIDTPTDFGIVVIHNATKHQTTVCSSRGVTVAPEYVTRARRFGCDGDPNHGNVTVGQILAARVPTLDKADWHIVLAGHSRYELLKEATEEIYVPW